MKKVGLWLSLLLAGAAPAAAQVTLEVEPEQDQFLQGESLLVKARITNFSGRDLRVGTEENWLTFSIESRDGLVVSKKGEAEVPGNFDLPSSKKATVQTDLGPWFSLSQPGRYAIVATARIAGWDRELVSKPSTFYLIEGAKLWEREIGLPQAAGGTGAPQVRKYVLQQANYTKGQLRLYLRVVDGSGTKTLRVVQVGPMVSFARPEPQLDRLNQLHLIYQYGPQAFSYSVFNPDGELVARQIYDYINTRPRLMADGEGNISVTGGVRRVTSQDIPPPKTELQTPTSAPMPTPAPTPAPPAKP